MIIARPTDNKIVINNTARRSYRKSLLVCNHLVESNEKSATESAGTRDRFILDKCKDKCYCRAENRKVRLRKVRKGDLVEFVLEEAKRVRPNG